MQGIGASFLSTLIVVAVIILGIIASLIISKILSKTILKGMPSSFVLELPPYRKPQVGKILIRSIMDRTVFVLGRAIVSAAPAGLIIWILANVGIDGTSLLTIVANFFDPFAKLMGLDGYILTAFILGMPANEIVLPIILMSYLKSNALVDLEDTFVIGEILRQNGWTLLTAINVMIFTIFHFPCMTTLLTIKKETGSLKWTAIAFLIPTICGIALCMLTTAIFRTLGTHHFIRIFLYWCYMGIFKISIIISIIYTNLKEFTSSKIISNNPSLYIFIVVSYPAFIQANTSFSSPIIPVSLQSIVIQIVAAFF